MALNDIFDRICRLKLTESTTLQAFSWLKEGSIAGDFLVIADEQSDGKGRSGHIWHSPIGGLWFTAGLFNRMLLYNVTIYTGICLHKAILKLCPELKSKLKLKWPNDVYHEEKKLAGIITNFYPAYNYHLIGIGVNTNISTIRPEILNKATSTKILLNREIDNELLLTEFFNVFFDNLEDFSDMGLNPYLDYYNENDFLKGREVKISNGIEGIGVGINEAGELLLKTEKGVKNIVAGSVENY